MSVRSGLGTQRGANVVEMIEDLLEAGEVEGDHRLQVLGAMEHIKQVLDTLDPVDEFVDARDAAQAA